MFDMKVFLSVAFIKYADYISTNEKTNKLQVRSKVKHTFEDLIIKIDCILFIHSYKAVSLLAVI